MIPVDVLRQLAIEWRREADMIDDGGPVPVGGILKGAAYRQHATELDDVADHYTKESLTS